MTIVNSLADAAIKSSPDPVSGVAIGALSGGVVGTVATGAALHTAGVTVAGVATAISTIGAGATATAIATFAAPIILPAAAGAAIVGGVFGTINWMKGGCKPIKW